VNGSDPISSKSFEPPPTFTSSLEWTPPKTLFVEPLTSTAHLPGPHVPPAKIAPGPAPPAPQSTAPAVASTLTVNVFIPITRAKVLGIVDEIAARKV
jgi:hypothetical protein